MKASLASGLDERGFVLLPGLVNATQIEGWRSALSQLVGDGHALRHADRRLPDLVGEIRSAMTSTVEAIVGTGSVVLDATLFRKPPATNWKVPWHQDLLVAARTKVDLDGWRKWSFKDDIWHVQPPINVLERLVAVRIHVSDCGPDDGPLRLLPGSHRHGVLPAGGIADQTAKPDEYVCEASAGDVLLMRPLVLHTSRIAQGRSDRMVLHLVLGSAEDLRGTPLVES